MTELVRQWLLGVVCTALVLAAADSLAPEGAVKKVCRLAGGMALLIAAAGPVLHIDEKGLSQAISGYQASVQAYEKDLKEKNILFYQAIIEETTAAYIVDKAEGLGISCQVEVTFAYDEDGVPCPWEVTAQGVWTEEQLGQLGQLLEADLGVPDQRQHYEERQP